jgi:hypothetical protein
MRFGVRGLGEAVYPDLREFEDMTVCAGRAFGVVSQIVLSVSVAVGHARYSPAIPLELSSIATGSRLAI